MADDDYKNTVSIDISDLVTAVKNGNQNTAIIAQQLKLNFAERAAVYTKLATAYSTSGGTLVSSSPCYLVSISVTGASTGTTGLCYDSASVANAAASNAFLVIPSSGLMVVDWPVQNGLVVQPSSQGTHTVCVSYA